MRCKIGRSGFSFRVFGAVFAVFGVLVLAGPGCCDVVTDWNTVTMEVIRNDNTLPGPTYSSRCFAMVHLAIYDVVSAFHTSHEQYLATPSPAPETSLEAAASQAAHDILIDTYPDQGETLGNALATQLQAIPNGPGKDAGIAFGAETAATCLRVRLRDNAFDAEGEFLDGDEPGEWRRTFPNFADPLAPLWGDVTPFSIRSGSQFRAPAPPALDSAEYAESFNEVKEYGSIDSASRTEDQTEIGIFWAYDRAGLGPPPVLYNQILQVIAGQKGNTVQENARLFALVNMAQADGAIACWETKYTFNLWRPITGIREADTDGNPATLADPNWLPLGAPGGDDPDFTPPFPAYTSGHATFGGVIFQMLRNFYGTDEADFVLASDELPGVTRTYSTFSQAEMENSLSRVYLGVHWGFDSTRGTAFGNQIADSIFNSFLRPKHDGDIDKDGEVGPEDLLLFQQAWYGKDGD